MGLEHGPQKGGASAGALLQGETGHIQHLRGAGLDVSEPSIPHGCDLLSSEAQSILNRNKLYISSVSIVYGIPASFRASARMDTIEGRRSFRITHANPNARKVYFEKKVHHWLSSPTRDAVNGIRKIIDIGHAFMAARKCRDVEITRLLALMGCQDSSRLPAFLLA